MMAWPFQIYTYNPFSLRTDQFLTLGLLALAAKVLASWTPFPGFLYATIITIQTITVNNTYFLLQESWKFTQHT